MIYLLGDLAPLSIAPELGVQLIASSSEPMTLDEWNATEDHGIKTDATQV